MALIDYTPGLAGTARVAAVLSQEIQLKLADRASLHNHPSIVNFGNMAGRGSAALQVPILGLDGSDLLASAADGAVVANTTFTAAAATLTIGRYALRYDLTDLGGAITDSIGLNAQRLAESMVGSTLMAFQNALCDVIDGFTTTAGSTGVDMSVDDFYSAQFALTLASVSGPYICVLHPRQLADFQSSLRAEYGATQFVMATQEMLNIKGQGMAGSFNGVEIYSSSKCPTANAGADRAGAMFGYGAVGFVEGSPFPIVGAAGVVTPAGSPVVVEFDRIVGGGTTSILASYYLGIGKLQDGMGVSIITDA
jgi:hypothetical protein